MDGRLPSSSQGLLEASNLSKSKILIYFRYRAIYSVEVEQLLYNNLIVGSECV